MTEPQQEEKWFLPFFPIENDYYDEIEKKIPEIKIKCCQLKLTQPILHENKIWEIVNIMALCNPRLRSFLILDKNTGRKKTIIYPRNFEFKINSDGCIIFQDE